MIGGHQGRSARRGLELPALGQSANRHRYPCNPIVLRNERESLLNDIIVTGFRAGCKVDSTWIQLRHGHKKRGRV